MDYIKATVINTDGPEIQQILSGLNLYDDLLLMSGQVNSETDMEVNYLTEQGDIIKLGNIPNEIITRIEDCTSNDVWVDIVDFGTYKKDDGTLKLWVGIEVKEEKKKPGIGIPLIIGVGAVTAALAMMVAVIKFITLYRKNRS